MKKAKQKAKHEVAKQDLFVKRDELEAKRSTMEQDMSDIDFGLSIIANELSEADEISDEEEE